MPARPPLLTRNEDRLRQGNEFYVHPKFKASARMVDPIREFRRAQHWDGLKPERANYRRANYRAYIDNGLPSKKGTAAETFPYVYNMSIASRLLAVNSIASP